MVVEDGILAYITRDRGASRRSHDLLLGGSPRASIDLLKAAKTYAALQGHAFVIPDDVKALVPPVYRHRIILRPEAEIEGVDADAAAAPDCGAGGGAPLMQAMAIPARLLTPLAFWSSCRVPQPGGWGARGRLRWLWPRAGSSCGWPRCGPIGAWRPDPRAWDLARGHEDRLSLAVWNRVAVTVRLRGRAVRRSDVWLRDEPPVAFRAGGRAGADRPGGARRRDRTGLPCAPAAARGDYAFGDLYLRWSSPLGLLRRQARFPAAGPVKVYPNLADVRAYDLVVRKNRIWELGLRPTRVLGAGSDFERLRDYVPDDEYRQINWKATARRGKPITAEYQTERSQNLVALLDVGRMMRSPVGDVDKLDYAINAVLTAGVRGRGQGRSGGAAGLRRPADGLAVAAGRQGAVLSYAGIALRGAGPGDGT